jgi:hypothetical protein
LLIAAQYRAVFNSWTSQVVLLCSQGDPAEFVEGEDARAGNGPDA